MRHDPHSITWRLALSMGCLLALAACTNTPPAANSQTASPIDPAMETFGHVHGVLTDPGSGHVLIAGHLGLFDLAPSGRSTRIGPAIDLMGFAEAESGRLLASGHPGAGTGLPEPAGLLESQDGGQSWSSLSRGGQSDFHALAAYNGGVYGYDGSLVHTADGGQWSTLDVPSAVFLLTTSPDGRSLLAGDERGLVRSTDGGLSWSTPEAEPLLQVVDWSDEGTDVVGVDVEDRVWTSTDGGATWAGGLEVSSTPQAIEVRGTGTARQVTVVTTTGIEQTTGLQAPVDLLVSAD